MSDPVRRLVDQLTRLPSVGEKTATRLAYHILRDRQDLARDLAEALVSVAEDVRLCSVCCNLSGTDPCPICAEPRRDVGLVCVVEQPQDIPAVEQSGEYSGSVPRTSTWPSSSPGCVTATCRR